LTGPAPNRWASVCCSADGTRLAAAAAGGLVYTSTNSGATWVPANAPSTNWSSIATSADGCKLVAVVNGGGIYTWQTTPAPVLNITPSAGNLVLSWTVPSMSFVLQQTPNLTGTNWTDLASAPALNYPTLQNQVTIPASAGTMFYRLVSR
jgi:hypothetical protein